MKGPEAEVEEQHTVKVAMLGESGVGKTCIIERYVSDMFNEYSEPTKGAAFKVKTIRSNDGKIELKLNIWDTAGQEIYRSLAPFYYKDADAIVVVYDITNQKSFEALDFWLGELKQHAPKDCLLTLVGNKSDKLDEEKVSPSTAKNLADSRNASHFTVSAKENLAINQVFLDIVARKHPNLCDQLGLKGTQSQIDSDIISGPKSVDGVKIKPNRKKDDKNGGCCHK